MKTTIKGRSSRLEQS